MSQPTFGQEQVRYFLEQLGVEMKAKYDAQLSHALLLFDAIMEPGARCEAAKEVFKRWFENLFYFAVAQTATERGREFLGVDVVKPDPVPTEESEDEKKQDPPGYYAY